MALSRRYFCFLLFCIYLLLPACSSRQKNAENLYREWQGETIVFPDSLQSRIMGKDTSCLDMLEARAKIMVYIDSSGCSPCRMELAAWSLRLEEMDTMSLRGELIFIVNISDFRTIDLGLKNQYFTHPVFYDTSHRMEILNPKLTDSPVNTFLLDRNNNVILIGSPANNDKLWELYKHQIRELSAKK